MDAVHAWKSPRYREELAAAGVEVPEHPSGSSNVRMLTDTELGAVNGAITGSKCIVSAVGTGWCAATYVFDC
ncbi:mersacidin/lichenicidin family type 2 lantibiotic [Nocardiopsis alba]|uniref:mersacidin/lichenicidin family type 2 lantibiotic n=1 Tax=Nocardiopsis alba TaxID=53437 RepID=UPI000A0226DB